MLVLFYELLVVLKQIDPLLVIPTVGIYERYVCIVIELQVDQFLYQLWSI